MQCERCNKKKATVFYRENINGRVKALRLCGDCVEVLEQAGELEDMGTVLSGVPSPLLVSEDASPVRGDKHFPQKILSHLRRKFRKSRRAGAFGMSRLLCGLCSRVGRAPAGPARTSPAHGTGIGGVSGPQGDRGTAFGAAGAAEGGGVHRGIRKGGGSAG